MKGGGKVTDETKRSHQVRSFWLVPRSKVAYKLVCENSSLVHSDLAAHAGRKSAQTYLLEHKLKQPKCVQTLKQTCWDHAVWTLKWVHAPSQMHLWGNGKEKQSKSIDIDNILTINAIKVYLDVSKCGILERLVSVYNMCCINLCLFSA